MKGGSIFIWNTYRKENASAYWSTGSLHHYRWTCGVYRLSSPPLREMEAPRQWPTPIKLVLRPFAEGGRLYSKTTRSDYKVGKGDFCGVLCERGPELVAALLGVNASGAAYVPLDAVYPTSRLEAMLEDSRAKCVIGNAALTSTRIPSMPALHLETVASEGEGSGIVRRLISDGAVVRQGSGRRSSPVETI